MNWTKVSFFEEFAPVVYGYWYDGPWKHYAAGMVYSVSELPQVPWNLALAMRCSGWAFVRPEDTNPGECWSEEVFSEIDVNML